MMNRLWRLVSVCLIVALCWHPSGHVDCKEQLPEAQTLPTVLDASQEEEPGEESHLKVKEEWVFQPLSEDGLLTEGDPAEEELVTQGWVEEQEHVQEEEELVAEPEPEPLIEPEQPPPEPEQPPPEPSVTQDQQPSPTPDLSPPPPPPAPAAEDPSSTPPSEDSTFNSVPEDATADIPVSDPSNTDLAAECEAGETNPYDSPHASLPAVLENTSNAHSGGTKPHVDPLVTQGANASRMLKEQGLSSHVATETDPSVPNKDPEDIPTFDEWKKKMMEVEKEKIQSTHTSSNGGSHPGKKVQKNFNNYASVECGAKILGSNPEAKSTSAILMENMDMYMLNPCSNKIWFIIELCEPIQVKQLDIANFELFSSTPKDFLVSISDRYPTNKWLKLGTFHGRDERTVQSFPLDEHLYAKYVKMFTKYIKVELVSHFGSEHFCPLSLIRVFGTSMVEEYEEIADPTERSEDQEDDVDNPVGYDPADDKSSKNLIGSAKDVILNMVTNIAVNVLGGGPEMEGNFSTQELNMTETSTSSQLDPTTTLTPVPDTVEVDQPDIQVDLDVTITEAPTPDSPIPETPSTEQDQIVTPIQEKDDDSVQSTITLLDGEEEEVDERGREEHYNPDIRQQESLDYCELSSSSSSSSSLSCTCSASLQEYLHRQCSVMLTTQRKHNIQERVPEVFLPQVDKPLFPPVSQTPQQPHPQGDQPKEREPTPAQEASPMEAPQLPQDHTEALGEPSSELPQLEPSQTSSLPSSTDSPTTRPTPAVEPSQASTKDLPKQRHPDAEKSHEVHAEEEEEEEKKKKKEEQQQQQHQPTLTFTAAATAPTSTRTDSSATVDQSWGAPTEEKPSLEVDLPEQDAPVHTKDVAGPPYPLLPAPNSPTEQAVPRPEPESSSSVSEESHSAAGAGVTDPLDSHAVSTEIKGEELVEDILFTSSNSNGQPPRPTSSSPSPTHSEFYAELHNTTEPVNGNGNQVHGSSQKESVFMRLNNRIKALEMNMSLSGRYLEQLSQRYRKQMEEMQRAFNTTIIKLQNTSRIAEEQDQRQTESIQALQGQLENITQLVLKLSVRVSQLQSEVSDRQSYLLLCLVLCLFLGLLLCIHYCRMSAMPPSTDPEPPIPKSYSYYSPERRCSYDDTGLKRRASYPLLHSDSFQLPTTEGPELPHTVEPQRFSAANRKKKRSKMKPIEKVETLKSTAPLLANGVPVCNGAPHSIDTTPPREGLSHPTFKDSPSEGSSEGSSQSDEPSFCGIAACTRLCDGMPPPKSRAEKRAFKRRRSKQGCVVVDLLQAPRRDKSQATPIPTLQDLMRGNKELNTGTFGVTALSGPV